MPTVIAVWPNNTISVIRMPPGFTMVDLYDEIDAEADPLGAECYLAKADDDGMYITFNWKRLDYGESVGPKTKDIRIGAMYGKVKKLKWPEDITRRWIAMIARAGRRARIEESSAFMSAAEIPSFPAPPSQTFTVDEVNRMPLFCGVYFAYDDDGSVYYVGESERVPKRVRKTRPEIGDRRIGVIRCEKHERKRIEAYFVAMLNPPGNGASTHRMLERSEMDEAQLTGEGESTDGR